MELKTWETSGIPYSNITGTSTQMWVVTGCGLPAWVTPQVLQSSQQRWAMHSTKNKDGQSCAQPTNQDEQCAQTRNKDGISA